ncbi:hypothetical protein G6F56_004521 [Rhizopus delemar]|nr:hypothetical protein G6F56_004521 [Rhizopus delemar]
MYSLYPQRQFASPLSITNDNDAFLNSTVDPSFVINDFSTPLFQPLDDCSALYLDFSSPLTEFQPTLPLSHVHPLQTLSPTAHDTFFLFPPAEETEFNQETQSDIRESSDTLTKEELKSLSLSPARELLSEDEEDCTEPDAINLDDNDSYTGEQDNDSDWERPKRTNKRAKISPPSKKRKRSAPVLADTDVQCSHCETSKTSLWRRSPKGEILCNACGLYLKLHGIIRPLSLKSDVIKRRNRIGSCKHYSRKSKKQKYSTL